MITLLGSLLGFLSAAFPDFLKLFRDAQGRTVVLHGLFAVWKQAPYVPAATDSLENPSLPSFTEGDADIVRDLGLNAVRLAWNWQGVEPAPGVYDEAYLNGIAAVQAPPDLGTDPDRASAPHTTTTPAGD